METRTVNSEQRQQILQQIGKMNILAISGGRVVGLPDGIELQVSNGYHVRVQLLADDTYRVSRVFKRAGKVHDKGHMDGVYCDEVGEMAYFASCFRNDSGDWTYGRPDLTTEEKS